LRNGHFLSNGTAIDLAITWSSCIICVILPCVIYKSIVNISILLASQYVFWAYVF